MFSLPNRTNIRAYRCVWLAIATVCTAESLGTNVRYTTSQRVTDGQTQRKTKQTDTPHYYTRRRTLLRLHYNVAPFLPSHSFTVFFLLYPCLQFCLINFLYISHTHTLLHTFYVYSSLLSSFAFLAIHFSLLSLIVFPSCSLPLLPLYVFLFFLFFFTVYSYLFVSLL